MVQKSSYFLFLMFFAIYEFSIYVSNDMILPAVTHVYESLHEPMAHTPLSLAYFLMGSTLPQVCIGPLSDRFGRRVVLMWIAFGVLLGQVLAIFSSNIEIYNIARFLQGFGTCSVAACGYATINELFDSKESVKKMAFLGALSLIAPMLGPVVGGYLFFWTHSWRLIFIVTGVITAIGYVGLFFFMPDSLPKSDRQPIVVKKIFFSYTKMLFTPVFIVPTLTYAFLFSSLMFWISTGPFVFMGNWGYSPVVYGNMQIPVFLSFIVGNLCVSFLIKYYSLQWCINWGYVFCSFVLFLFFIPDHLLLSRSVGPVILIGTMCMLNLGLSFISSPLIRLVLENSSQPAGITSCFFWFIIMGTGVFGSALFSLIVPSFSVVLFFSRCLATFTFLALGFNLIVYFIKKRGRYL